MVDYSKGQIYKVCDKSFTKCYIGSSTQALSKRMENHRLCFKKYLNGKFHFISVFELFNEFGVENCKIYWIEDYACNSKKELEKREGEYIEKTDCVNKKVAGRDKQQYYQDTREERLEKAKEYRDTHKEERKEYFKQRYENHRVEMAEDKKLYRQTNLDKVREQERQAYLRNKAVKQRPFTCECGATMCFNARSRHFKTKKHQQYLQNQNNPQE